jgi:hypothetical protein
LMRDLGDALRIAGVDVEEQGEEEGYLVEEDLGPIKPGARVAATKGGAAPSGNLPASALTPPSDSPNPNPPTNPSPNSNPSQSTSNATDMQNQTTQGSEEGSSILVSAPGKVILFGEHAVVHGVVRDSPL